MTPWDRPDRSDDQVQQFTQGWAWKTHDGRWMPLWTLPEALRLWSMDRHA